jgi:hypothetical protein
MSNTSQTTKRGGGPTTEEGKKRVSLNALKHGMSAKSPQAVAAVAEQCESEIEFERILSEMNGHYHPADPIEDQLVRRIAVCIWRLQAAETLERSALIRRDGKRYLSDKHLTTIVKLERYTDLHLHRAIRALTRKRETEKIEKQQNKLVPRSARA